MANQVKYVEPSKGGFLRGWAIFSIVLPFAICLLICFCFCAIGALANNPDGLKRIRGCLELILPKPLLDKMFEGKGGAESSPPPANAPAEDFTDVNKAKE
jgi:hypothetical protein